MPTFQSDHPKRLVAIYVRVSTAEQNREGYSPEHQRKRLLEYIEGNPGLNLKSRPDLVFDDVGTGNDLNRPDLDRLRSLVKKKAIQGVIVWRIDRLSRNLKHLLMLFEEFQQHEVSFISLQENIDFTGPIGRLIFQIFGSLAQFERELIRGRTHAGKMTSAEMGNYIHGNTPYGYRKVPNPGTKGKKLELIEEEKRWVETIFDWYVYQGWGDLKIAKELNNRAVPVKSVRKGKRSEWTEIRVRRLLINSLYYGHCVSITKDEEGRRLAPHEQTITQVPPCVSEVLWRQAQKIRETRKGGRSEHPYLLSGKVVDVSADLEEPRKFVGAPRTKGGHCYRRKQVTNKSTGEKLSSFELPAKQLEDFVWSKIMSAFRDPRVFVKKYLNLQKQDERVRQIEASLKALRLRETQIKDIELPNSERAYLKGVFSEERFSRIQIELNQELEHAGEKIRDLEADLEGLVWVRTEAESLKSASSELNKRLQTLTREHKKMLCGLFVDRVDITRTEYPGKKRIVEADVYFRFNLSRLIEDAGAVCTPSAQTETAIADHLNTASDNVGGRYRSGKHLIHVSARYHKIQKRSRNPNFSNSYLVSAWRELS
ncbi:MAG: recombinase family protein [Pseudomonadota bacterium]